MTKLTKKENRVGYLISISIMEESILANVKNATVVIGLMEPKSDIPHEIIGSGFIFNPNGYVATAGHVADLAYKKYEEWNAKTNLCT